VPRSVLEAIRCGDYFFEPLAQPAEELKATAALPGSREKLEVLADRARKGLPLWHPEDRRCYDESQEL